MHIHKNDLLWKGYQRYYRDEEHKPPPGNLCRYFWRGVGGLVALWWEMPVYVAGTVLLGASAGAAWGCYRLLRTRPEEWGVVWAMILLGALSLTLAFLTLIRFAVAFDQLASKTRYGEAVKIGLGFYLILWLLSAFVTGPLLGYEVGWPFFGVTFLVSGALLVGLPLIALSAGFIALYVLKPAGATRAAYTFWCYLKALKHRVCPLVEAPDEET